MLSLVMLDAKFERVCAGNWPGKQPISKAATRKLLLREQIITPIPPVFRRTALGDGLNPAVARSTNLAPLAVLGALTHFADLGIGFLNHVFM
jgi:hypothetical protein